MASTVILLAGGILMVGQTLVATPNEAILLGALLVIAGIVQAVRSARSRKWHDLFLFLLGGLLSVLAVLLAVLPAPVESRSVSLAMVAALTLGGALRFLATFRERIAPAMWLLVLASLASIGVGLHIHFTLPWSSALSILGTVVGTDLIFQSLGQIASDLVQRAGAAATADPPGG